MSMESNLSTPSTLSKNLIRFRGADEAGDCATHEFGFLLDVAKTLDVLFQTNDDILANLLVRVLTSAELQGNAHFVAFGKEGFDVAQLHLIVVLVDVGVEFDFLDDGLVLVLLRLLLAPVLLVFELAVIHDAANGRGGVGVDFDQVESGVVGEPERLAGGDDADLRTVGTQASDFRRANARVDARLRRVGVVAVVFAVVIALALLRGGRIRSGIGDCDGDLRGWIWFLVGWNLVGLWICAYYK